MSETASTNDSMIQPHTSGSELSLSGRPLNVTEPVVAKRVCFYKSGDPQFNGVKMVVNSRSFKSFDALLDNLSKRVPLPFGVRNITTPRGIHSITNLEDLEDGKSYICSQQRKVKPINLEKASKKPLPWQISRPVSGRRKAIQLARGAEGGVFQQGGTVRISTPKKLLVFKNGDVRIRRTIILGKKNTQNFEAFMDHISELMQYPVVKLYTTDGRKVCTQGKPKKCELLSAAAINGGTLSMTNIPVIETQVVGLAVILEALPQRWVMMLCDDAWGSLPGPAILTTTGGLQGVLTGSTEPFVKEHLVP